MTPELLAALQPILTKLAFQPLVEHLTALAANDAEFRGQLRALAHVLLAVTEETPVPAAEPVPAASAGLLPAEPPPALSTPANLSLASMLRLFEDRAAPPEPAPSFPGPPQVSDTDLPLIEARCRLKADAARWAAERLRLLRSGADYADIESQDRAIVARARALPDCFLWMCHRDAPAPADLSLFEDLAGSFEAAADATAMLKIIATQPVEPEEFNLTLDLNAEAQSALRVAVGMVNRSGSYTDNDQLKMFIWLRETADDRHYFIRRHMRREDPADPTGWHGLRERLARLAGRLRRGRDREKRQRELFKRAGYHLRRIHAEPHGDHAHDWHKVIETIDELIDDGLPPSNVELRDFLLPILDEIPDEIELPRNAQWAMRSIDQYLASRPDVPVVEAAAAPIEEVRRAADLLHGRSIVLIGGDRRPSAAEALQSLLGLRELIWIETREHQTHAGFESYVARDDVAVVVLAIRWSSHGFGEVKEFCDKYGKPLVRLPAGYSPNQVAYHIIHQVGDRLAGRNGAAG